MKIVNNVDPSDPAVVYQGEAIAVVKEQVLTACNECPNRDRLQIPKRTFSFRNTEHN